jgi:hypothetical protein
VHEPQQLREVCTREQCVHAPAIGCEGGKRGVTAASEDGALELVVEGELGEQHVGEPLDDEEEHHDQPARVGRGDND